MRNSFKYWVNLRERVINSDKGKPITYYILKHFGKEKYLELRDIKARQSICKLRISTHILRIETGIQKKFEKAERLCCFVLGKIEDEQHSLCEFQVQDA